MPTQNTIPTVVISNFAEAHIDFLGRSSDPEERDDLINGEDYHGDRTILWADDPKLVIVNYPIAHAEFNVKRLGYSRTSHLAPHEPSHYLCLDILREAHLLEGILQYAAPNGIVQLIPYATTKEFLQLVEVLRREHHLQVLTPESPDADHFWLRDYIDTKTGFRTLASFWMTDASRFLPFGMICETLKHAAIVAHWFCSRGEACVVKTDTGESGIGTTVISPEDHLSVEGIFEKLHSQPFYSNELIVVEKYIPSANRISPSAEVKVPKLGEGEPQITYISNQLFLGFGDFCGIQIDRSIYSEPWCADLKRCTLELAHNLQNMGYVGHFDLDCIVSDDNEVYLLEINARRTGGTHVHEFGKYTFGDDYVSKVSLISFEASNSGTITDAMELLEVIKDFLYPMPGDEPLGMVVTITKPLFKNRFGCIVVAPTSERALQLQAQVDEHIQRYCQSK
ncbi:MAG TPA: hypothetical protein PLI75_06865 [Anaerolineales bacterium]|nr:hypothetical protein [Anaerolineales bacterium]